MTRPSMEPLAHRSARLAPVAPHRPLLSVVLLVENQAPLLARCLQVLAATLPADLQFEVVVVDNGSVDATGDVLAMVSGDIRVVRHAVPVPGCMALEGALASCAATYVCLLDVAHPPSGPWIEPLLRALDEVQVLGAVLPADPGDPASAGHVVVRTGVLRGAGGFTACAEPSVLAVVAAVKIAGHPVATVNVAPIADAPAGVTNAPMGEVTGVAPSPIASAGGPPGMRPSGSGRRSRKILHVGLGHPPTWINCGPVVYVHTLAKAQRENGDDVAVLAASDEQLPGASPYTPSVTAVDGVPYVLLTNRPVSIHDPLRPGREVHDPDCRRAVERVLHELRPDIVHVHNLVGLSFDVVAAARASGARVVMSLHNYFPLCSRDDLFFADAEHCAGPVRRSCSRCLGTMIGDGPYRSRLQAAIEALNSCDVLLAVSRRVAEIYRDHGVDPELLRVDKIGSLTAARMWERFGRDRVALGAPPSEPLRLVFFGSPIPRKGLVTALQAFGRVARPERVELHVLGTPPAEEGPFLRACLEALPPAHAARVSFDGPFLQATLDAKLAAMDVAVLPPRWEDNGPQTVIEALGAGLPVVGTRMGGLLDFVHHERNGLLVPEGDPTALAAALDRLADDAAYVTRLRSGITAPLSLEEHRRGLDLHYEGAGAPARLGVPIATGAA